MSGPRLWLVGDDEALDILAELSRHLDYFQVARVDELPGAPLSGDDHVVIGTLDRARGRGIAGHAYEAGSPGHVSVVPELPGRSVGARAIAAAAVLVELGR